MNCERTESLMVDFLYGELSDDNAAEFFKHMNSCEKCPRNLNELSHLRTLMKNIPEITDPSMKWQSPPKASRPEKSRAKWYWAAAAVIMLAGLSLFVVFNTSFRYEQGVVSLTFGTERLASLPETGSSLTEQELSKKDIEKILRYINYMENKYNAERDIITVQLENLASSTLHEFRKRDEMLQWLITYSNVKVEPASLQER